ncbi:hypothetical protein ACLE20_00180 [Rhizobium sp. YIM 134829]|uniref:hypothetical protein n=1 Tax=Rhizobium sp. YIM 134829 TaxID=3390453 RepID=UPI00397E257F
MTARYRPLHSGFETLRTASPARRAPHAGFGSAANEQMTATGYARIARPNTLFAELIQR